MLKFGVILVSGWLDRKGISYRLQTERCLLTPSCGLGSTSPEAAELALELLAERTAGGHVLRHQEDAGGLGVQPVHHMGPAVRPPRRGIPIHVGRQRVK